MKVLHVVATRQHRGAETFACDLVRRLAQESVIQHVAVLRKADPPLLEFPSPTTEIGSSRGLSGAGPLRLARLRRLMRSERPDVIQAHGGEALKYATIAGSHSATPLVYRRIGAVVPAIESGIRRVVYSRLIRKSARVIAVSEAIREETIRTFGLSSDKTVTIPNAADVQRLMPSSSRDAVRRTLGVPSDAVVVLSLGALVWEKDPLEHLAVMRPVLDKKPDVVHIFAGDGPLRSRLEDAVRVRGVNGRTMLLGARDDVADLLAASDVVLFASRSEGMPAALIEAGLSALPVAAYSVGGVPEIIVDGETGFLAPSGDRSALQAYVEKLVADGQLRAALGARARQRCLENFEIGVVADRYLSLYESLLGPTPPKRPGRSSPRLR